MGQSQAYINHTLVHWGEEFLWDPTKVRKQKSSETSSLLITSGSEGASKSDQVRAHIAALVRKPPQVMVKITGGGADMKRISSHIDYITRSGKFKKKDQDELEIETEDGQLVKGKEARDDLKDLFAWGDAPIPAELHDTLDPRLTTRQKRQRREALNVIFSMPHGINRVAVKAAASAAAKEIFKNHHHILVHHSDTAHQHTHVLVKMAGHDGIRLNPRKADLEQWRITFAKELNARSIDAIATRRRVRVKREKGVPQAIRQMRDRGVQPNNDKSAKTQPAALKKARMFEVKTIRAYKEIAKALSSSRLKEDRNMATMLINYVREAQQSQQSHKIRPNGPRPGL